MHHAREWPAAEMPLEFAMDLVRSYGKDPRMTKILDTTRVIVMPVTNADGYDHSRAHPIERGPLRRPVPPQDLLVPDPGRAPRRARRRSASTPTATTASPGAVRARARVPLYDTYRGPSAFSEPET